MELNRVASPENVPILSNVVFYICRHVSYQAGIDNLILSGEVIKNCVRKSERTKLIDHIDSHYSTEP